MSWEPRFDVFRGDGTLDGRVSGEEVREVKVVIEVREGELILYDEW